MVRLPSRCVRSMRSLFPASSRGTLGGGDSLVPFHQFSHTEAASRVGTERDRLDGRPRPLPTPFRHNTREWVSYTKKWATLEAKGCPEEEGTSDLHNFERVGKGRKEESVDRCSQEAASDTSSAPREGRGARGVRSRGPSAAISTTMARPSTSAPLRAST